ncbi:MAG: PEP/pyruvate-binding domain-containing protein [Caulobacteraceae bacterium]
MDWIVGALDQECVEEGVAGGKGASLARLCRLGVSPPPFFVISARAYREMGEGSASEALIEELRQALAKLDVSGGVAVRSSAIGEDAADASFAGLYHTSLDVRGLEAVAEAVRTCWASYRGEAAAQYRRSRGGADEGAMAVVVQEMVHGQWSGVCFTAHPVKLALSEGLVNAAPGLGEALVSGEVNPEEITVRAADGRVLERRPGAEPRPFPEAAAAEVWRVSKMIAEKLSFPQDVEWAWRDERLFVLQSRPITTIADVFYSRMLEPWRDDPNADPDNPGRIWSRMLADETWVSPISPLFYNIHNSTPGRVNFIRSHGDRSPLPPDIFKYHRAIAYADVTMIQRMYEFQPRMARIRGLQNFLPADMRVAFLRAPFRWRGRLERNLSYETGPQRSMRSIFHNYKQVAAQWPDYVAKSDRWFDIDLDSLSLENLRAHQAEAQQAMAQVGPPCGIAVLSHASDLHLLLTGLLERWGRRLGSDGENLYARISAGLDDSETVRESEALWEIAQRLRALGPQILDFARTASWAQFKANLEGAEGQALVEEFEGFWRRHRHLGSTYKDLIWPRWGDDIDMCFGVVKGYADSAAQRPSLVNARSAQARREAQKEILASLRGPLAPPRRRILRWLFRYNEIYMSVRDNHRYYVDRNWYELRRIFRSYGRRLTDAGVLTDRDEVFFLGLSEIEAGLKGELGGVEAARRIEVRRRVWQMTLRQQGPKFLKGWAPYNDEPRKAEERADLLHGIPASPGSAVGAARIIYDVRDLGDVRDGEILVTRQTDPSWTTVFGRISGLVLETGGVLSHGTSLCREYGLPCVTAVEQATVKIPNGRRIELSGTDGAIRIPEEA